MENRARSTRPQYPFLIGFLLLERILRWVFENACDCFLPSFRAKLEISFPGGSILNSSEKDDPPMKFESTQSGCSDGGDVLTGEDVKMVLKKLGGLCSPGDDEKLPQDCLDRHHFSLLFEEKEPSLGELREAFWFFDQNRDDHIDAKELQRVLLSLGMREGSSIEACQQMIRAFDENGDGRIDFSEFVKFMERIFCS